MKKKLFPPEDFKSTDISLNVASGKNHFLMMALLILRWLSGRHFFINNAKIILFYLFFTTNAYATKTKQLYNFDVHEKTFSAALDRIVKQTGTLVLYPPKLAKEEGINSIVGRYSINEALNIMLKHKSFSAGLTKRGVIVISQNNKNEASNMKEKDLSLKTKVSTLVASIALATSAMAQDTNVDNTIAVEENKNTLERIIVTSRRISENLQDIPVSVSSFSAKNMEARGVQNITDLQMFVPNATLQVGRATNSTLQAYIRGIGIQDPLWGYEPGVSIYIDEVFMARPQGAVLDTLDLERIEVLRGPQGTVFGKNTIGGALSFVTKRLDNEGYLNTELRVGSYNQRDLIISGATPLIDDKFYFGGSVASVNRDGFGEFVNLNQDNYNKEVVTGRIKLEATPTNDWFIRLTLDKTKDDTNAKGSHRLTGSTIPGFEDEKPLSNVYDSAGIEPYQNQVINKGVSLLAEWEINNNWAFKSITAKRFGDTPMTNIDADGSKAQSLGVPVIYSDEQFTQEFQVSYGDDKLSGVAGVFYFNGDSGGVYGVVLGEQLVMPTDYTIETGGTLKTESFAAYAQGSYQLDEQWSVTLGARVTYDEKSAHFFQKHYYHLRYPWDAAETPDNISSEFENSESWNEFTPYIGTEYKVNDATMVYVNYRNADKPFDPETVDTYEFGIKSDLLDGSLRINAAVFYNDYTDQQLDLVTFNDLGNQVTEVLNAGTSYTQGVEVETTWLVSDKLTLHFNMGYLDADYESIKVIDENGDEDDIADEFQFANTPKITSNLGFTYLNEINNWNLSINGDWAFRDEVKLDSKLATLTQESYSLFNLGASVESPNGQWRISLNGRNLTDEEYLVANYHSLDFGLDPNIVGFYGSPRTVTLSVRYSL
jgi:iron complex outermembrane receptor protein